MCRLSLVSLRWKSDAGLYDGEIASDQKITYLSDIPTNRDLGNHVYPPAARV
jgi:hypothetical protein